MGGKKMFKVNQIYKVVQGPKQSVCGKEIIRKTDDIGKIVMVEEVKECNDGSTKCKVLYVEPSKAGKIAWFTEEELEYIGDADASAVKEITALNEEYMYRDQTLEYCKKNINGLLTRNSMEFLYSKIGYKSRYSETGDVMDIGIDQYDWVRNMRPIFRAIFDADMDALNIAIEVASPLVDVDRLMEFYKEVNDGI